MNMYTQSLDISQPQEFDLSGSSFINQTAYGSDAINMSASTPSYLEQSSRQESMMHSYDYFAEVEQGIMKNVFFTSMQVRDLPTIEAPTVFQETKEDDACLESAALKSSSAKKPAQVVKSIAKGRKAKVQKSQAVKKSQAQPKGPRTINQVKAAKQGGQKHSRDIVLDSSEPASSWQSSNSTTKSNKSSGYDVDSIENCHLIEKEVNASSVGGDSTEHSENQHHQNIEEEDIMRIDIRSSNSSRINGLSGSALEDTESQIHGAYAASEGAIGQSDVHIPLSYLAVSSAPSQDEATSSPSTSDRPGQGSMHRLEKGKAKLIQSPQLTSEMAQQNFLRNDKKTEAQEEILLQYFNSYGPLDYGEEPKFWSMIVRTGLSKDQIYKWFWERQEKIEKNISSKRLAYPGVIFKIRNTKTGKDCTPTSKDFFKPLTIFKVEKADQMAAEEAEI